MVECWNNGETKERNDGMVEQWNNEGKEMPKAKVQRRGNGMLE